MNKKTLCKKAFTKKKMILKYFNNILSVSVKQGSWEIFFYKILFNLRKEELFWLNCKFSIWCWLYLNLFQNKYHSLGAKKTWVSLNKSRYLYLWRFLLIFKNEKIKRRRFSSRKITFNLMSIKWQGLLINTLNWKYL